jgi:putative ABC transport system ATP-binding protein
VPTCLQFDSVSLVLDGTTVLDRVDCRVPEDGITVISGPSGSGKSTLLRMCNRLDVPTSGRVLFRGVDLAGVDPVEHRRRVGMVFQRPTPFAGTGADNLAVAGVTERATAVDLFGRVGLDAALLDEPTDHLSGGEAQRLCLARTLATGCEVLLADECTSALDPESTDVLESLARRLATSGTTVLWVTHDSAQADRLADHRIVVDGGRVVA